jgi:hypothetical protein
VLFSLPLISFAPSAVLCQFWFSALASRRQQYPEFASSVADCGLTACQPGRDRVGAGPRGQEGSKQVIIFGRPRWGRDKWVRSHVFASNPSSTKRPVISAPSRRPQSSIGRLDASNPVHFPDLPPTGFQSRAPGATAVFVDQFDAPGFLRRALRVPWRSGCPRLSHFDERLCGNA